RRPGRVTSSVHSLPSPPARGRAPAGVRGDSSCLNLLPWIPAFAGTNGELSARLGRRTKRMINWGNFISQCFNGLVLGALLALISSGLTIIYGTLGVLNLAHGAMFMLGGYAGWVAYSYTGSFIVAVLIGSLFVAIVGVLMERIVIRHFYTRPHEDQLLVTFGLGIVAVALLALYVVLYRTRIGMIVRAGIEDAVMVDSLGIDVYRVFMLVFG